MLGLSLRHQTGWWVAACCGVVTSALVLSMVALVGLIVLGQGSGGGRAEFPADALPAAGGAPAGCVLEDGDLLAAPGCLPVSVLSCWDSAWNLKVVSPDSTR
jgi:hypothetical protein